MEHNMTREEEKTKQQEKIEIVKLRKQMTKNHEPRRNSVASCRINYTSDGASNVPQFLVSLKRCHTNHKTRTMVVNAKNKQHKEKQMLRTSTIRRRQMESR